jgi:hypothetical protein
MINWKSIFLIVWFGSVMPSPAVPDESALKAQLGNVAAKLIERIPFDKAIVVKTLSPEETGLPEDFLRSLTSDIVAEIFSQSNFRLQLINRIATEELWLEAIEFGDANFDELMALQKAQLLLLISPRATANGVQASFTVYNLDGNNAGQVVATSGSELLLVDMQGELGVDITTLNDQVNTIIQKLDDNEKESPLRADVIYKRYIRGKEATEPCPKDLFLTDCYSAKIVADVNGNKYVVSSDDGINLIIFTEDLDNDGFFDAIVENSYGGNAIPPWYEIISYRGEGRFSTFPLDTYSWEEPKFFKEGERWVIRAKKTSFGVENTELEDEIVEYRIVDGNLDTKSFGNRMFNFSIATFTSEEAIKNAKNNDEYSWSFDFDRDTEDEILQCRIWKRWGVIIDCHIHDQNGSWALVHSDPTIKGSHGAQCKVISVSEELLNGFHKLKCDFDEIILKKILP